MPRWRALFVLANRHRRHRCNAAVGKARHCLSPAPSFRRPGPDRAQVFADRAMSEGTQIAPRPSAAAAPSPASLCSAPSPALRERGYNTFSSKPLSRNAGEGGPSPQGLVGEGSTAFQQRDPARRDGVRVRQTTIAILVLVWLQMLDDAGFSAAEIVLVPDIAGRGARRNCPYIRGSLRLGFERPQAVTGRAAAS